jgi:hypothetical protein
LAGAYGIKLMVKSNMLYSLVARPAWQHAVQQAGWMQQKYMPCK